MQIGMKGACRKLKLAILCLRAGLGACARGSVLASGARCLRRLMNSACVEVVNRFILKSPLAISHCIKVDLMLLFFI